MKASLACIFVWLNFSFHFSFFLLLMVVILYFIFIWVKLFDDFKFANIKYFDEYLTDILNTNLMVVTRSLCVVISDDKIVKAKYKYENTPNSSKIDENILSKYTTSISWWSNSQWRTIWWWIIRLSQFWHPYFWKAFSTVFHFSHVSQFKP